MTHSNIESYLSSPKNKALLRPTVIEVGRDGFITVPHVGSFGSNADVKEGGRLNSVELKWTLPITEHLLETNQQSRAPTEINLENLNEPKVETEVRIQPETLFIEEDEKEIAKLDKSKPLNTGNMLF